VAARRQVAIRQAGLTPAQYATQLANKAVTVPNESKALC
jgi:hypothetical protein